MNPLVALDATMTTSNRHLISLETDTFSPWIHLYIPLYLSNVVLAIYPLVPMYIMVRMHVKSGYGLHRRCSVTGECFFG